MMMRWDVILRLLPSAGGRYVEIGVGDGITAAHVQGAWKEGVDPQPQPGAYAHYDKIHAVASDAFFAACHAEPYDVVFIDGLHVAAQVHRDIMHALGHLRPGGAVVIHDCNPRCEYEQRVPRPNVRGRWLGDGWRVIAGLRQVVPNLLEVMVIDTDEGIGLVRPRPGVDAGALARELVTHKGIVLDASYDELVHHRTQWLGLVAPAAWKGTPHASSAPRRKVVVTAIFGGYEPLREPAIVDPAWDYVCVTDDPGLAGEKSAWRLLVVAPPSCPRRAAREVKARIHRYVPEADWTLWIDGSFALLVSPSAIAAAMGEGEMGCFVHPERNDIYSEGRECQTLGKGDHVVIADQLRRYETEGYQSRWLAALGILFRRMTPGIKTHGERWWQEIMAGCERDQVCFPLVCDELGIVPQRLPGDNRRTAFARYHRHWWPSGASVAADPRPARAKPPGPAVLDVLRAARDAPLGPPILRTHIAYDPQMDLGRAYNAIMERMAEDEWAVLLDHDAMFTTPAWYHQIRAAITAHPEAGVLTAVTNRIGNPRQRIAGMSADEHDMRVHRARGHELFAQHYAKVIDITDDKPFSGVLMVMSKRVWAAIEGFKSGFLGVDTRLHVDLQRAGRRVLMMPGLYVYHWYRYGTTLDHHTLLRPTDRIPYEP